MIGLQASMGLARADVDLSANATGKPTSTKDIEAMQKQIAELTSQVKFLNGGKAKPDQMTSNSTNAEVEIVGESHAATARTRYMAQFSQSSVVGTGPQAEANKGFDTVTSPIETIRQGRLYIQLEIILFTLNSMFEKIADRCVS